MTQNIRSFYYVMLAAALMACPAFGQDTETPEENISTPQVQRVVFKATLLKGGSDIPSKLNWNIADKATGDVVFEKADAGTVEFEIAPGDYIATAAWTGWPHGSAETPDEKIGTTEFTIGDAAQENVTIPIDPGLQAIIETEGTIGEGERITIRWTGPDDLGAQISVNRFDDEPQANIYGFSAQRGREAYEKGAEKAEKDIDSNADGRFNQDDMAEADIAAPSSDGDYEVRYTLDNPPLILARAPLKVTDGKYTISAPEEVKASESFSAKWAGRLTEGDFIAIEKRGAPAAFTEEGKGPALKDGEAGIELTAPAMPGEYELRYVLVNDDTSYEGMQAAVQATAPIKVLAVEADLRGPEEITGGSTVTFDVSPAGDTWQDDYVSIVKPGEIKFNRDSWITLGKQKDNPGKEATFQAPSIAGNYELAYFLVPGDKVLIRKPIKVVQAVTTVKAPATVKAGDAFDITYSGDAFKGDRIIICPADTPDSAMWRWSLKFGFEVKEGETVGTYSEALSASNLVGKPGEYEARYVTGKQNVILARDTFTVTK